MENRSLANRIFRGTVIITLVSLLTKLTSFVAEAILAAKLGTTAQSDAYYMVISVHNVIYPMLSVGVWKVFLPLYKSHLARNELDTANSLINKSLSFFFTISFGIVVLLILFAPAFVSVIAPGFEGETKDLCVRLVRISAPKFVFTIASAVFATVLQCHEKFFGSQIREVASHVPTIIAALFFYQAFGFDSLAIALVVAGVLRLVIELAFINWDYKFKLDFKYRTAEFALMLKRLPSALVTAGVAKLNTLIDKAMASTLPSGTISCLNYGVKLMHVFSGLLSTAIATATYPQMIELISLKKNEELAKLVVKIVNIFCVLMVPVTIACVLFRSELVSAVFERGAFDSSSTAATASIFALYSLGLFFIACNALLSNIFYGNGDTRMAMYIGFANLGINVALNFAFMFVWGANGLALATSLSAILSFLIRFFAAKKYVRLQNRQMLVTGLKVLAASVAACFLPRVLFWIIPVNKYVVLLSSALIGACVYLLLVKLLKVNEINDLFVLLRRKVKKA